MGDCIPDSLFVRCDSYAGVRWVIVNSSRSFLPTLPSLSAAHRRRQSMINQGDRGGCYFSLAALWSSPTALRWFLRVEGTVGFSS